MMLLVTMFLSVNVFAATITSATVTLTPSKTECKSGDTIEFTISLKDLQASSGILGFGAYIDYDSNLLTLEPTAKGVSGWTDADISEKTHRFITTKNSHSENNEDILKITFTAKEVTSDVATSVKLKKIEISNGVDYTINEISSNNVTIKTESTTNPEKPPVDEDDNKGEQDPDKPTNPSTPNNPNDNENSNNNNNDNPNQPDSPVNPDESNNSNEQQGDLDSPNIPSGNNNETNNNANNSNSSIPQLGASRILLIIIAIIIVIAVILFIKIKIIDKKMKKNK